MAKESKTNAMRILEKSGLDYQAHTYPHGGSAVDGVSVAQLLGQPKEQVFKTLVTQGHSRNYYVFVVPVAGELDLKAAARAVDEKSVEMIAVKDINRVTGYVRGGCSPIGMKKQYVTIIDESCKAQKSIIFSGGRIGLQIEMGTRALLDLTGAKTALICTG